MPTYSPVYENEASFLQTVYNNKEIQGTAATEEITITRNSCNNDLTVPILSWKEEENKRIAAENIKLKAEGKDTIPLYEILVNYPESATFAAGEYSTSFIIDVSILPVGKVFTDELMIVDTTVTNVNVSNTRSKITLQKVYTWVPIGTGQYMDFFFMGAPIDVEILKADGFNRYRVMNPYPKDVISAGVPAGWYAGGQISYFDFNINEDGTIRWDGELKSGAVNASIGDNAYIWGYYPLDYHSSQTKEAALCKTLEDGQIIQMYIAWLIENSTSWYGYNAAYINMPNSTIDFDAWLAE